MKILQLRFKNLNSLQGEWLIDFTHAMYEENGLFALTGPTGAGKTTILDAICLALYGQTPRLGRISKSDNEIMSRQSGECYAEVVFMSQGVAYCCHWEQRRARKMADGKLQDPEHVIAHANGGTIIESKKSRVQAVIEEKTGMDFDRFSRSILLAQGSFDGFLKASIGEKSEILEQITGTAIYSDISRQVHAKQKMAKEALWQLQAEEGAIVVLDAAEEVEKRHALQMAEQAILAQQQVLNGVQQSIQWQQDLEGVQSQIDQLLVDKKAWLAQKEDFLPTKQALILANQAATVAPKYDQWSTLNQRQQEDEQALILVQQDLPIKNTHVHEMNKQCQQAQSDYEEKLKQLEAADLVFKQVRSFDAKFEQIQQEHSKWQASIEQSQAAIEQLKRTIVLQKTQLEEQKTAHQTINDYLVEYQADATLVQNLSSLQWQLQQLVPLEAAYQQSLQMQVIHQTTEQQTHKALMAATLAFEQAKQQQKDAEQAYLGSHAALEAALNGRLLREYRQEKEALLKEQALWLRIQSYEAERQHLVNGHACPLCGSLSHPFVDETVVKVDGLADQIQALDVYIANLEELNNKHQQLLLLQQQQQGNVQLAKVNTERVEANYQQAIEAANQAKKAVIEQQCALDTAQKALQNALSPLSIVAAEHRGEDLLALLQQRLNKWQTAKTEQDNSLQQQQQIAGEMQQNVVLLAQQEKQCHEQQQQAEQIKAEAKMCRASRLALLGEQNVDVLEAEKKQVLANAKVQLDQYMALLQTAKQTVALLLEQQQHLQAAITLRNSPLQSLAADFDAALASHGFRDQAAYQMAIVPHEKCLAWQEIEHQLENAGSALQAKLQDKEALKEGLQNKTTNIEPLLTLQQTLANLQGEYKVQLEEIAQLRVVLAQNEEAKLAITDKQLLIAKSRSHCEQWDSLHGLIGSADGKKFRNFAQGLTFEIMVQHANLQLQKMSDRYLLLRDEEEPLLLNVLDNYQAGEIRSTKNLSGGESFIISLALALGLSKMASRKVSVDSLFLDEGFGTLDEEALETALEALANLQAEGKLIGVISHVPALKERIATQIQVKPKQGGKSALLGFGVRHLS